MSVAVNQQLRLAHGEHGQIVVTAAWCGRCRREVLPRDDGSCSWCGSLIVDEDALPAKRLLELLDGEGEATYTAETAAVEDGLNADLDELLGHEPEDGLEETPEPIALGPDGDGVSSSPDSPTGPVEPAPRVSEETSSHAGDGASTSRRRGRRRVEYDRAEIREQLLRFHEEHGREPTFADIKSFGDVLPPALAAVEWRDVAVELGWADPTAPKRATRPPRTQPVVVEAAAPAVLDGFTVDDLWALYEVAGGVELRAKLRRAIERALSGAAA